MTQNRSFEVIDRLRRLREDERSLRRMLVGDLAPFQKPDDRSFFTLPTSDMKGISVASTCTALMALIDAGEIDTLFPEGGPTPGDLFTKVVAASWRSSKLPDLNAFTSCMVIRAAGFVVSAGNILSGEKVVALPHKSKELQKIVENIGEAPAKGFSVKRYPAKATMAYWFVDGVTQAGITIGPKAWKAIADWSAREFERQLSYVGSGNDSLMDPASFGHGRFINLPVA